MSLTGAIVARFDDDSDATITTLQGLIDVLYADEVPSSEAVTPYAIVFEVSETPIAEGKDYTYRIDAAFVQFNCFADSKHEVDDILEAIENAYRNTTLTIDDASQIGRPLVMQSDVFKEDMSDLWQGWIEFRYLLEATLS